MSSGDESLVEEFDNDLEIIEERGEAVQDEEILENFAEAEVNNEEANGVTTENQQITETDDKKVVKPKRVIKNPQPKLNEQTLQGPKGLSTIQNYFDRIKFKGRGYEEQDLNVLMKTYEYWCHRLFPKFPFDDCIGRLEKLGTKKATQTQIKRLRMGLDLADPEKPIVSDEEENHTGDFVDSYNDQFDQLLPSTSNKPPSEISDEQMERIQQNKERAQKLREERLRKIKEQSQNNIEQSNENSCTIINSSGAQHENESRCLSPAENLNESEGEEDNIDNILDFINTEEKSKTSNKRLLESDSEDEAANDISKKTVVKANRRKHILESDEDEEADTQNENIHMPNQINQSDEDDIENILTDINIDDLPATRARKSENEKTKIKCFSNFDNKTQNAEGDSEKENTINDDISSENKLLNTNKSKFLNTEESSELRLENSERYSLLGNNNRPTLPTEKTTENLVETQTEKNCLGNTITGTNSNTDIHKINSRLNIEAKGIEIVNIGKSENSDNILPRSKDIQILSNILLQSNLGNQFHEIENVLSKDSNDSRQGENNIQNAHVENKISDTGDNKD